MTEFGPVTVDGPQPATEREKLILRAIADPGAFCQQRRWKDTASGALGWIYEPVPAWGARAVVIALAGEAAVVDAAKAWRAVETQPSYYGRVAAMNDLAAAVDALDGPLGSTNNAVPAPNGAPKSEDDDGQAGKRDLDHCPQSKRVDHPGAHSWRFDGDDPRVECVYCGQLRDALSGYVYREGNRG